MGLVLGVLGLSARAGIVRITWGAGAESGSKGRPGAAPHSWFTVTWIVVEWQRLPETPVTVCV